MSAPLYNKYIKNREHKKLKQKERGIKNEKTRKGKNIFGNKCREKILKLNKETAMDQYKEMIKDLLVNGKNSCIEYTIDLSCFTKEEEEAFFRSVEGINSLFARMMNRN